MPFFISACVFILDRITKHLASAYIDVHQSIPVINGFFHLTLVHNSGAAFGLLKNQVPLFIVTSLCAVVLIIRDLLLNRPHRLYNCALSLILAGAAGNLVDRLFLGYVVDFLDFRVWPVFNVADSAITIGVCLLGYLILTGKDKKQ